MSRRLIALWVLLSLLGYGTAWAWDMHESPVGAGALTQAKADATMITGAVSDAVADAIDGAMAGALHSDLPGDHASGPDCDHCCHGLSHLLGLSRSLSVLVRPAAGSVQLAQAVVFNSRVCSPDLRPPIV